MNNIPSSFKIILYGQLIVNFPVSIIILLIVMLFTYLDFGMALGALVGSGVGWYFWDKFLKIWVKWALDKGVKRETLFKLGKIGLINFYKNRIFDDTYIY